MVAIECYDSFADMPAAWLAGFEQAGQQADFCLTPGWLRHLAASTGTAGQSLRLYCLQREGAARILLPMMCQPHAGWPGAQRLQAQANYYSALAGPLMVDPVADQRDLPALMAAIVAERPRYSRIDLHPLAREEAGFAALHQALRSCGLAVRPYYCFGNWYLDVAGRSYDQYHATLPSRLRNTLARKSQQLRAAGDVEITIIEQGAALERGIADYQAVYQASWKQAEPYPDFIPGLIRLCASQGKLRLGIVRIDGQAAAAQLWIVHHGVAAIYKLAYDERFAALSVGSVLTARMMQHVIDIDGVREVDYLMGDDGYKRDWMSHRRERWGLAAFNPLTADGLAGLLRHDMGRLWRRLSSVLATSLHYSKKTSGGAAF